MPHALIRLIDDWLGRERSCACGRTHAVTTRVARFDDRAGSAVVEFLRSLNGVMSALVVADARTARVADAVASTLSSAGVRAGGHVFGSRASGSLVADERSVATLDSAVRDARPQCLVGVGSGTINDLCKTIASAHAVPYVCCPTAASMNGYTSTVASLKRSGLKVTDPVRAPDAVMVDLDVIRRAPAMMAAAGVADLLSKFVTAADWTLARMIEGGYHCDVPANMAARATDAVVDGLDAIGEGSAEGAHTVSAALILSGLSMAVAGSSAPASGAEHLISHYWDMCVPDAAGVRLHGTQVGVGTLISATLYEILREVDPATIDPAAAAGIVSPIDTIEADLGDHFGDAAPAVIEQARRKYRTPVQVHARAAVIKDRWPAIWATVAPALKSSAEIRELLRRVGAPTTLDELHLAFDDGLNALRWSRHIRARYTVFDFASDIGLFGADRRLALLRRSGVIAG